MVYLDAIHLKVKQDGHIINKAAYMAIGIDLDNEEGRSRHVGRRKRIGEILAKRAE